MQKCFFPPILAILIHVPLFAQAPDPGGSSSANLTAKSGVAGGPLSLASALDQALRMNPDLAAATHEVDAMDGAVRQAGIVRNPELAVMIEDRERATRTSTIQLNQPIELGGKRSARIRAATGGRDIAAIDLAAKRLDIRAATIAAFYDVLIAQQRHRLALASADVAARASTATAKRVIAGKISPVEESKARIAESGARLDLAQAASDLAGTRQRLSAIWGDATPSFDRVDGDLLALPNVPDLDQLVMRIPTLPGFQRAQLEVVRRTALSDIERAKRIPDLTVVIGAKREEQLARTQAIIGVSIPLPLFDRNQGNVQEALRRTEKARDEFTGTEVRLHAELTQIYQRLKVARDEAHLLQSNILPAAQSNYDAAVKGFEYGKFGYLDMLDAQRTLAHANSQYLRALGETYRAFAELERIAGPADVTKPLEK